MNTSDLGDPQEIILREYGHPAGDQIHAFRGWNLARAHSWRGLVKELCVIYLTTKGLVVIAFVPLQPDEDQNKVAEFASLAMADSWEVAEEWGRMNAPAPDAFERAWADARAAAGLET